MPVQPFLNLLHDVQSIACRHGVPENNGVRCPACREEQMSSLRVVPQSHPADEDRLTRDLDVYLCTPDGPLRLTDYVEIIPSQPGAIPPWADPHIIEEGDRVSPIWPVEVK